MEQSQRKKLLMFALVLAAIFIAYDVSRYYDQIFAGCVAPGFSIVTGLLSALFWGASATEFTNSRTDKNLNAGAAIMAAAALGFSEAVTCVIH